MCPFTWVAPLTTFLPFYAICLHLYAWYKVKLKTFIFCIYFTMFIPEKLLNIMFTHHEIWKKIVLIVKNKFRCCIGPFSIHKDWSWFELTCKTYSHKNIGNRTNLTILVASHAQAKKEANWGGSTCNWSARLIGYSRAWKYDKYVLV